MTNSTSLLSAVLPAFAAACKFVPMELRAVNRVTGVARSYPLAHPFAFIGRVKRVNVQLDDPSVSQCHAYLQVVDGVPHCFDLGSRTGLLWDDGGRGQGPIYPGHTVRIGVFDCQINGGAEPVADEAEDNNIDLVNKPVAHAVLEVHSPETNGHFSLDREVTLIGRHPSCHLRLFDQEIAYFQCALVATAAGVWFLDMPNRKGTALNGRAVRLSRLRDGDLIELGRVSLVFRDGEPAEQSLVLTAQSRPTNTIEPSAPVVRPGSVNVMEATMAPIREMMEQFQQSFVTMARMFTVMQQEHTAMMCEQMRQLMELMRETREVHPPAAALPTPPASATTTASPAGTPPPANAKVPTPKATVGPQADALAEAHNWFMDRMAKLGQPQPPSPKRN